MWRMFLSRNIEAQLQGSRGAAVVAALLAGGTWSGPPCLLLGPSRTLDCIARYDEVTDVLSYVGVPLCIYHGVQDEVLRIATVRDEAAVSVTSLKASPTRSNVLLFPGRTLSLL
jgi:hypothetical protein